MADSNQRALGAVLSGPAFRTRLGGAVMTTANRHVERWAPETDSHKQRSLRSLGFVDRLITPWVETAQRSASMRMFQSVRAGETPVRDTSPVSWVFPRPWYQDELDWMAAARQTGQLQARSGAAERGVLTTRGTYVPSSASQRVPAALHEYVAPSMSIAPAQGFGLQPAGVGYGGNDAYSSLIPLAAVQAAALMQRTVAPALATTPSMRGVLTTLLARTSAAGTASEPSRISQFAPEMVTPPAPRSAVAPASASAFVASVSGRAGASLVGNENDRVQAEQAAYALAEQHAHLARVEQVVRVTAARELAAGRVREAAETQQRAESVAQATEQVRREREQAAVAAVTADRTVEQRRIEERIAQRVVERQRERATEQRLHESSRAQAADHVRMPLPELGPTVAASPIERRAPAEVIAAIAALPAELQTVVANSIAQHPDQAFMVIAQVSEQLRAAELMARTSAANESMEVTRGPRTLMPSGLGGLVATVERAHPVQPMFGGARGDVPLATVAQRRDASVLRAPNLPSVFVAPRGESSMSYVASSSSALGATTNASPAALTHVAWADRWLARFAGATPKALEAFEGTSHQRALSAPQSVFVAPMFSSPAERPAMQRYDDNAETPDEVFLQISAAATKRRTAQTQITQSAPSAAITPLRPSLADLVAHAAPTAPDAGLGAQLAASPFAPALRHMMPLPVQQSFDVRALFGAELSANYLAGTLASPSRALGAPFRALEAPSRTLEISSPQLDYVAPQAWAPSTMRNDLLATSEMFADSSSSSTQPYSTSPSTASSSMSLSAESDSASPSAASYQRSLYSPSFLESASRNAPVSGTAARTMVDAMALPMLFASTMGEGAIAAPGMIAERALGWSVAQERSSGDLAYDFVSPELVLAARVYGLGPADAAMASRLALAGPSQLTAMAGAVDRTFVQAMAVEADRARIANAYPTTTATTTAMTASAGAAGRATSNVGGDDARLETPHRPTPSSTAFGVDRRTPRGSYLWPAATVAALGMTAPAPDSDHGMSIAALELLAARAVTELGTFAAMSGGASASMASMARRGITSEPSVDASAPLLEGDVRDERPATDAAAGSPFAAGGLPFVGAAAAAGSPFAAAGSPFAAAGSGFAAAGSGFAARSGATMSTTTAQTRARFDALYLAIGASPEGRSISPAARAARALALAGRGEDAPVSAYERAAAAWNVLPVVYAAEASGSSPTAERAAAARRTSVTTSGVDARFDARPGLSLLSGRAGEALGSYVAPLVSGATEQYAAEVATAAAGDAAPNFRVPLSQRVGSVAPELVQTGSRSSARSGGGEAEIPAWFEKAARKMLAERTGQSDGISLAELTLINTTAPQQIAAAPDSAPAGGGGGARAPSAGTAESSSAGKVDIDQVANEVYEQLMQMMDAARARNGEPYL